MTDMPGTAAGQPGGLRERKKARTRATIREHALRLIREQGYHATTVEQIAAAAEVSPSTFFRYFPTKEDVVLQDDMEMLMLEAFERQPPEVGLVAAVRAATREVQGSLDQAQWDQMRQTVELTMTIPEIRARALDDFSRTIAMMAEAAAKRTGRSPDDLAVRAVAGAIIGVVMSVTTPWNDWSGEHINTDMFARMDAGLAHLENGLRL
jgi:AcrR family transcriptional regulator